MLRLQVLTHPTTSMLRTLTLLVALRLVAFAGTPGIFQGQIYKDAKPAPGWIYVQARKGRLRKVEIARARIVYAASVAAADRAGDPASDLTEGAEVEVTAEQDGNGEWRASRVEILRIQRSHKPAERSQAHSNLL